MPRKTDYPEFQKLPVKVVLSSGKEFDGLVVDANYHIGITVVAANDHDRHLLCLNRKQAFHTAAGLSFQGKFEELKALPHHKRAYSIMFYYMIEQIKAGELNGINSLYTKLLEEVCSFKRSGCGAGATCAWQ